jgi:hypothetical protein
LLSIRLKHAHGGAVVAKDIDDIEINIAIAPRSQHMTPIAFIRDYGTSACER